MGKSAIHQVIFVERNQKFTRVKQKTIVRNPALTRRRYLNGQVKKSIRGMPWHWEPKKDVISCEKLR